MPKKLSIKKIERSGTLTNGSPVVTITTTSMVVGDPIYGTGIPAGTRIRLIDVMAGTITLGNSTLTADVNATADGSQTLSVMTDDIVVKKAERLNKTVKINGVDFDGSEDITVSDEPTAQEVLDLIKTVDGPNSGLDADLLDGEQGSYYASREYVDEVAQGLKAAPAAEVATTANLSATYNNGTAGVGATLTATANGAFPTIDGYTLTSTTLGLSGVLVKNQTNAAHNGRYNLTQQGTESLPWILTKCIVCDESDEIPGSYIFVKHGTLYANTGWVANVADQATFTVGTDAVNYFQFSGVGTFTAGDGLDLTGSEFSVDTDRVVVKDVNGNITVSGGITIGGDLTINGTTTTLNTRELTVDDKNIELGSVVQKTGLIATLATGVNTVTLTTGNTSGVIPGQLLTKTAGTGVFGTGARVGVITSATVFTVVNAAGAALNHTTAGSITFTIEGASDASAAGGGITLKGTTDKTIVWNNATAGWEFNQPITTNGIINRTTANSVVITQNSIPILSTFKHPTGSTQVPLGENTFVGKSGNTTMGSTATSTVHASFNTAVGSESLKSNTTGYSNSALGRDSLLSNTTGNENSAFGQSSLRSNTTGSSNSAVGSGALSLNTTGSSNSAVGLSAGSYIANGSSPNSTGTNSVFIGANTKALANAQTNQIVIGHDAIGLGSNTVVLGNASIVTTALRGNVGIGTTSPSSGVKLEVVGNARVSGQYQYGANAYTEYNATDKSIDFVFTD